MSRSAPDGGSRERRGGPSRARDRGVARLLHREGAFPMEPSMTRLSPPAVVLVLAACSCSMYDLEGDSDDNLGAVDDTASEPAEGDADSAIDTWRVDVFPAPGTRAGERDILP